MKDSESDQIYSMGATMVSSLNSKALIKIDKHISDLLQDNKCVIVPKMGGFISNHSLKEIQSLRNTSKPFSEKLSFNVLLNYNDGLLANHLVKNEKLTYNDALKEIEKYVDEFHKKLESGKKFIIEEVGIIYKDTSSNVRIEPIKNPNYSVSSIYPVDTADSFTSHDLTNSVEKSGMVKLPDLIDSVGNTNQSSNSVSDIEFNQATEKQHQKSDTSSPILSEQNEFKTFKKVKFIILFTLMAGSVFWLCLNFYFSGNTDSSSVSNNSPAIVVTHQPVQKNIAKSADPVFSDDVNKENGKGGSDTSYTKKEGSLSNPSMASVNTNTGLPENKYFLIAGSFKSPDNAKRKLDELKLKGFKNAQIFSDNRSLQLVSYDSFTLFHEAQEKMNSIRMKNNEVWIYNR